MTLGDSLYPVLAKMWRKGHSFTVGGSASWHLWDGNPAAPVKINTTHGL